MLKKLIISAVIVIGLAGTLVVGGLFIVIVPFISGSVCSADDDPGALTSAQVVITDGEVRVRGQPLTGEQRSVAQEIIGQGRTRGLSDKDIITALATGYQESGLRNLSYGDRDSLGVFQQRPSQGWGTPAQILNVTYAVGKFYDVLETVKDRTSKTIKAVAMAVQRPSEAAYNSRENRFTDWIPLGVSLLSGATGSIIKELVTTTVQCTVASWTASATSPGASPPVTSAFGTIGTCPSGSNAGVATNVHGQRLQLCNVGGIVVEANISTQTAFLLAQAERDGINLAGSGFRSYERQVQLRRQHCGSSDYAVWRMPSGQCRPPTAIPGQSNHEVGRAIDFRSQYGGMSYGDPAHRWMRANAVGLGWREHPRESWHWEPRK